MQRLPIKQTTIAQCICFAATTIALLTIWVPQQSEAGARLSSTMAMDEDGHVPEALIPWRDFEQSYTQLFSTDGLPQTPGKTREFIQVVVQQIPSYTRSTGVSKEDIDMRKGASKLVMLMNQIPEMGSGKKECSVQELSMRIVFESIFAPNVHVNSFLKYYNSLYYNFCIQDIDRAIIKMTAKDGLELPDKFDSMQKSQLQAAKDLPQAHQAAQIARGLTLFLRTNGHNTERAGAKPAEHLKRMNKLVDTEIIAPFKCDQLKQFGELIMKYQLVSSMKAELSDDSRRWIDVIDLCDKIRTAKKQLILIDLYEHEAARVSTQIFMPANSPDFQHRNPESIEDDFKLIIDVLAAKKRLYREDQRHSISKLEEVKFTLSDTSEFCNLINVRKLQQLMVEYSGFPNVANYLLHKAKLVSSKCKEKIHTDIADKSKKLDKEDVAKLTSLRMRIVDATENQWKKRLYHHVPAESFVEGVMAFLLSSNYQKDDGFDIIAEYLAPKTPEEGQRLREGAYMLVGDLCDEVENYFASVHELFSEFDKLGVETNDFDEEDTNWMANVNICSIIKFGTI